MVACKPYLELVGGLVAREVDEVDGPRPGHDVDGDGEGEDGEEGEHGGEVVGGLPPHLVPELVAGEAAQLGAAHEDDDRDGGQVHAVADEVVVPQPHVLEVHRLQEVGQPTAHAHRERRRPGVRPRRLHAAVHDLRREQRLLPRHGRRPPALVWMGAELLLVGIEQCGEDEGEGQGSS